VSVRPARARVPAQEAGHRTEVGWILPLVEGGPYWLCWAACRCGRTVVQSVHDAQAGQADLAEAIERETLAGLHGVEV
jgi:hypothetical protein